MASSDVAEFEGFGVPVTYPSDGRELAGYLKVPDGVGPHPALIFNHGSGGLVPVVVAAVEEFVQMGYAVFAPMRRGHNGNPGPFWNDLVTGEPQSGETMYAAVGRQLVEVLDDSCDDVLASLDWLSQRPEIDAGRIGVVGQSFGAIMVILAVGRTTKFKAGVTFAGAALTWPDVPALQRRLLASVGQCETPLFVIQAENDSSLQATYAIGAELARLGKPHELRIYPPSGSGPNEGHAFLRREPERWSSDVQRFLARWM